MELSKEQIELILKEDPIKCGTYRYAAISFASSGTRQRLNDPEKVAVKIRGAFSTKQQAMDYVQSVHAAGDTRFDVYIVDMYKFVLIGNVSDIPDPDATLTDMALAYSTRCLKNKNLFEERKKIVMEKGLEHDIAPEAVAIDDKEEEEEEEIEILDPSKSKSSETESNVSMSSDTCRIKVPGCNYFAISYIQKDPTYQSVDTPDGVIGLKIRGVYETKKQAEDGVKELSEFDQEYDIYVVDGYNWLLLPQEGESIETKYSEPFLNDMFTQYSENKKRAEVFKSTVEKQKILDGPSTSTA